MKKLLRFSVLTVVVIAIFMCTGSAATQNPAQWYTVDGITGGQILFDSTTGTILDANDTVAIANIPSVIDETTVTSIGDDAFCYCYALYQVTIPNTVVSIGEDAFALTAITTISIPDSVTDIGSGAFAGTPLSQVYLPDSLIILEDRVFSGCYNLGSITIPDTVISLGDMTFWGCTSLTTISLPVTLSNIGIETFVGCSRLVYIQISSENPYFSSYEGVLFNKDMTQLLVYPNGRSDEGYQIPDSIEVIVVAAFEGCQGITNINIPSSLTTIGEAAFLNCTNLSDVYYNGSISRQNDISIANTYASNDMIINATWHYNSVDTPQTDLAQPTSSSVVVNGVVVNLEAYNINDNNYFKLRDIATILSGSSKQFEVTWSEAKGIELISGQQYTTVGGELAEGDGTSKTYTNYNQSIYLDDVLLQLTAHTINENNFFKLRDLGEAIGFNVSWDNDAQTIVINSNEEYTAD